ncbi:MAG: extracellular solute-binding protein [Clostridia bacterium]|nr:extracellular solute-binding protein [Clostridia bacterium]
MKSLFSKMLVLVLVLAMAVSVFAIVAQATPAADSAQSTQNQTGTTNEEGGAGLTVEDPEAFYSKIGTEDDYAAYLKAHSDAARPNKQILLKGENAVQFNGETGEIIGKLPMIKRASQNTPADLRDGALFYDEGICGWVVNITEAGWYNVTLSYLAYDELTYTVDGVQYTVTSKSSDVQRRFYIDYKIPFYEARQVNFERVWKDASVLLVDSQTNNEKRPYQSETEQWQTLSVRDYMGYESEPFKFYLSEGTHTIAFGAIKEGMLVEYAMLHQVEQAPTYAELKAQYAQEGKTKVQGVKNLYVQAEGLHNPETYLGAQAETFLTTDLVNKYNNYINPLDTTAYDVTKDPTFAILKSSPTLYGITDRSSPASVPYSHSKIRYNTIGGDKWQSPNQWIEWSFDVEKAGLYAISFKARQNILNGMHTTRKLTINGEVPCQEALNITFLYGNSFNMYTLGDENETFYFYLEEGKNSIRLETTLGDLGGMLAKAEASLANLNKAYRRILMITSASPDPNRNYQLNVMVPDALQILKDEYVVLSNLEKEFIEVFGADAGAQLSTIKSMMLLLEQMNEDHNKIGEMFTSLKDSIASMGTWLNDMSETPLELDYFVITTEENLGYTSADNTVVPGKEELVSPKSTFFASVLHEIRSFIASFTEDYDNIGGTVAQDGQQPVKVWLETGAGLTGSRDNATILKQLIDDMFTKDTGIIVETRLVAGGSLLPSVLSGIGPEICLSRSAVDAVNYAFRGAVMNLANEELFPDYKDVLLNEERYAYSAIEPFKFGKGIYAVPETQDFFMTFYRTDILEELNLTPPKTWQDVYNIIGHLQHKQMTFAMPVPVVGAVGSGNLSYAMFLYQKGGTYYNEDYSATALTTDAALDAFKEWTGFYTQQDLPNTYDFANRFRTGEVPVGIASYSQYSQLAVFAPEIQGLWEFSLVPGTPQVDENGAPVLDENGQQIIDRSCASNTSGCVMLSIDTTNEEGVKRAQRAWKFMTWWTGEEAQYRFGTEIESLLGAAARYQTANLKAMKRLPWDKASMDMIQEQWSHTKGIPQVPGGYYTARNIEFAWKEVINNAAAEANTTFVEYVGKIDDEITRKREEFKDKIAEMLGKE